jgi:hypothetical protein
LENADLNISDTLTLEEATNKCTYYRGEKPCVGYDYQSISSKTQLEARGWVLGSPGTPCASFCQEQGATCDDDQYTDACKGIDTWKKTNTLAELMGQKGLCDNPHHLPNRAYPSPPMVNNQSSVCSYVDTLSPFQANPCSFSKPDHSLFCYCKAPKETKYYVRFGSNFIVKPPGGCSPQAQMTNLSSRKDSPEAVQLRFILEKNKQFISPSSKVKGSYSVPFEQCKDDPQCTGYHWHCSNSNCSCPINSSKIEEPCDNNFPTYAEFSLASDADDSRTINPIDAFKKQKQYWPPRIVNEANKNSKSTGDKQHHFGLFYEGSGPNIPTQCKQADVVITPYSDDSCSGATPGNHSYPGGQCSSAPPNQGTWSLIWCCPVTGEEPIMYVYHDDNCKDYNMQETFQAGQCNALENPGAQYPYLTVTCPDTAVNAANATEKINAPIVANMSSNKGSTSTGDKQHHFGLFLRR